jgi:hypothetical protein
VPRKGGVYGGGGVVKQAVNGVVHANEYYFGIVRKILEPGSGKRVSAAIDETQIRSNDTPTRNRFLMLHYGGVIFIADDDVDVGAGRRLCQLRRKLRLLAKTWNRTKQNRENSNKNRVLHTLPLEQTEPYFELGRRFMEIVYAQTASTALQKISLIYPYPAAIRIKEGSLQG